MTPPRESTSRKPLESALESAPDGVPAGARRAVVEPDLLLARACDGDRDAFDRLAVRAMPRLLGTARRLLGGAAEAEEAVADALFRAFRRLSEFRRGSAFETWVHRILCRVAVDRWRSRARDLRRREALFRRGERPAAPGPLQRAAGSEQVERVRAAIEGLPTLQRMVVVLHLWEGLSLHEVAALLPARYATVKSNLHHARESLRARLEGGAT